MRAVPEHLPEKVIRLEPRLNFTAAARSPRTIKEEEPAQCLRCGKAFGTKSSIERIVARLAGRNPLFRRPSRSSGSGCARTAGW